MRFSYPRCSFTQGKLTMSHMLGDVSVKEFRGPMSDLMQKIQSKGGRAFFEEFKNFLRQKPCWVKTTDDVPDVSSVFLKRLLACVDTSIPSTNGFLAIAEAVDVFTGYIDPDFKGWGTYKPGENTEPAKLAVYEVVKNGTFKEIFGSLGDLSRLCLQQAQIIEFCRTHQNLLRQDGYATFFLFEVDGSLFVAGVYVDLDGLDVNINRFDDPSVWGRDTRRRLVVPQIEG